MSRSSLLCGRDKAAVSDLWIFRHIWDTVEQQEVLAAIVGEALKAASPDPADHPRSRGDAPDPEALARDLEDLDKRLSDSAALRITAEDRWLFEEGA